MTIQLLLLGMLFSPFVYGGAELCSGVFGAGHIQTGTALAQGIYMKSYTPKDQTPVVAFISDLRRQVGIDPHFTADSRYLYSDLENPEDFYAQNRGAFNTLQDSDGNLIGTVGFTEVAPGVCELKKFYLSPLLRGQGLGKILLQEMFKQAKKMGFQKMILQTNTAMTTAIGLYEKMGFQKLKTQSLSPDAVYYAKDPI
jgi:ribosomal protein S18 acetylase RimI-like enzyme